MNNLIYKWDLKLKSASAGLVVGICSNIIP